MRRSDVPGGKTRLTALLVATVLLAQSTAATWIAPRVVYARRALVLVQTMVLSAFVVIILDDDREGTMGPQGLI